jgi:hypothetical protein
MRPRYNLHDGNAQQQLNPAIKDPFEVVDGGNGDSQQQALWLGDQRQSRNGSSAPALWKNTNVLFVRSELDDAGIPYRAFRILAHLRRRIGKSSHAATGIRGIAKVCRMKTSTVISELRWLEHKQWITIDQGGGGRKSNRYEFSINSKYLYLDHRLDDYGLSPAEFRVLAHISRLADVDDGHFFINDYDFAAICEMRWETVKSVCAFLEEKEFFVAYTICKNPMYHLYLNDLFPEPLERHREHQTNLRSRQQGCELGKNHPDTHRG